MRAGAKIYVAGHRGMVGSAIVRRLKARGFENIITRTHAELDLTRQAEVEAFVQAEKPDYIFIAAAKVGGIPDGTPRKLLDVSAAAAQGWTAQVPLAEGIALAYRDFLANHAKP